MRFQGGFRGRLLWTTLPVLVIQAVAGLDARADQRIHVGFFRPSLHGGDVLAVGSASTYRQWGFGAGVWFDYAYRPLAVDGGPDLVRHLFLTTLYGNVAFTDWLSVGLGIPLALVEAPGTGDFALSDLRLGIKGRILGGNGRGFGLALSADLTFPTATKDLYIGDELVTGTPQVILDWQGRGWTIAWNLGVRLKKPVDFILNGASVHTAGHQVMLGAGLVAPLLCGRLEGIGTLEFRTSLTRPFRSDYDNQLDLMAGLRGRFAGLVLTAAAGGGPLKGFGSPVVRGVVQVGYEGKTLDCGCAPTPPPDRDGDGLPDAEDQCPDQPGPRDTAGCPDRDGDGIPDGEDRCPEEPGPKALRGCPDRDRDGIADRDDACPDSPGEARFQGCPDSDGDGIPDPKDACPSEPAPGTPDGCPPKAVQQGDRIELLEPVFFEFDSVEFRPGSERILQHVARILAAHPQIRKVRIEGHTDDSGTERHNRNLSERRAEAVRRFLLGQGIPPEMLETRGYGLSRPMVPNTSEENRQRNRRVEFLILEQE